MSGFEEPNYTQVPNALFEFMADMSEAELKVTLAIIRKTKGWHKVQDTISISQFEAYTGLHRHSVIKGLKEAKARGTIAESKKRGPRGVKMYRLVTVETTSAKFAPVNRPTSAKSAPVTSAKSALLKSTTSAKSAPTKERGKDKEREKEKKPVAESMAPKIITAYVEAHGSKSPPVVTDYDRKNAVRVAQAGYTPEEVSALTSEKLRDKPSYPFSWLCADLPGWKEQRVNPPPAYHTMSPAEPPPPDLIPASKEEIIAALDEAKRKYRGESADDKQSA